MYGSVRLVYGVVYGEIMGAMRCMKGMKLMWYVGSVNLAYIEMDVGNG